MPFEEAENLEAFAKIAIYGRQGAGKTRTAAEIAIGISDALKARGIGKGKIAFIDTETGSNPLVPMFRERGVVLEVSRTRALKTVIADLQAAEGAYDCLIIDSVTHVWNQLKDDYQVANKRKRLMLYDWGPLKKPWEDFVTLFLRANIHIIACGRAGYVYEERETEDGKREQAVVDTKMKAEGEFEYETALTIEMELVNVGRRAGTSKGALVNRATILKDRTDTLNGLQIDFPTFEDIRPWFERLNIGGKHVGVNTEDRSTELFAADAADNDYRREQRRKVQLEEIAQNLNRAIPGASDAAKAARLDVVEWATGHRAWSFLENVASRAMVADVCRKVKVFRSLVESEQDKADGVMDFKFLWGVAEDEAAEAAVKPGAAQDKPPAQEPEEEGDESADDRQETMLGDEVPEKAEAKTEPQVAG